jgi:hypothetical protein
MSNTSSSNPHNKPDTTVTDAQLQMAHVLNQMERTKGAPDSPSRYNLYVAAMETLGQWSHQANDEKVIGSQLSESDPEPTLIVCARLEGYSSRFMADLLSLLSHALGDSGLHHDFNLTGIRKDEDGKYRYLYLHLPKSDQLEHALELLRNKTFLEQHLLCGAAPLSDAYQMAGDLTPNLPRAKLVGVATRVIEDIVRAPWQAEDQCKTCYLPLLSSADDARLKKMIEGSLQCAKFLTACDIVLNNGSREFVLYAPSKSPEVLRHIDCKLKAEKNALLFNMQTLGLTSKGALPSPHWADEKRPCYLEAMAHTILADVSKSAWVQEDNSFMAEAILPDVSDTFAGNLRNVVAKWLKQSLAFDEFPIIVRTFTVPDPSDERKGVLRFQFFCETDNEQAAAQLPFLIKQTCAEEEQKPASKRILPRICKEEISRAQTSFSRSMN